VFALPNAVHRDRCETVRADVEAALAAHFGRTVPLRLVVDGGVGGGGGPAPAVPDDLDPAEEVVDLDALVDAPSEPARSAVDRLTDAFPGAEVLEEGSR
jgi:DNA polymerase III subunit gamma/tau